MLQLNKSKEVLERLSILMTTRQSSGMNVLSELQEIGDMAQEALNEIEQAEMDAMPHRQHLKRMAANGNLLLGRRQGA